jgi:hypothetical protein
VRARERGGLTGMLGGVVGVFLEQWRGYMDCGGGLGGGDAHVTD